MNSLKLYSVKLISKCLKIIKRGGSLPGNLWLRIDPNVLKSIDYPQTIIVVTGTNGKTTTTNLIYQMMKKKYSKVICNDSGDNMLIGIASLILDNLKGNKINGDAMVLETDELNLPKVLQNIPVSHIVVLNLFRDQLDRFGEIESIITKFQNAFQDYRGYLILNHDDPNVIRLKENHKKCYSYGVKVKSFVDEGRKEAKEGRFCPICSHQLKYKVYYYAHIGKFYCPQCNFNHDKEDFTLTYQNERIYVNQMSFKPASTSIYSIYNYAAMLTLGNLLQIDFMKLSGIIEDFKVKKGRNEHFNINGIEVILNLVKNPTGMNEVLKEIENDASKKVICFILNDYPNDGIDVSWIYDANIEYVLNETCMLFVCSGTRSHDLALRLKYSNHTVAYEIEKDVKDAINLSINKGYKSYILSTYSNIVKVQKMLKRKSI